MHRRTRDLNGSEPALGGDHAAHLTGMEPALSRQFGPLYGRFRVRGLEAPSVTSRRRALVVFGEYDADTAQLIQLLVDSNGYEVRASADGLETLRLTQSLRPDLVVVNIRLAGVDGLRVIQAIRHDADDGLRCSPILVMDVQRRQQVILAAFEAGADDYLELPYDVPVLLRCWRRVTGAVRRPSPLTALQNEDVMIQQIALSFLLEMRPDGLVDGLIDLLAFPDPTIQIAVRWALRRLGSDEALAALQTCSTRPLTPASIL